MEVFPIRKNDIIDAVISYRKFECIVAFMGVGRIFSRGGH